LEWSVDKVGVGVDQWFLLMVNGSIQEAVVSELWTWACCRQQEEKKTAQIKGKKQLPLAEIAMKEGTMVDNLRGSHRRIRAEAVHKFSTEKMAEGGLHGSSRKCLPDAAVAA